MTKVLYLAEPIDQAGDYVWDDSLIQAVRNLGWAVYRPRTAWFIGRHAEPGPEVDQINREAIHRANAVVAVLPDGVPTIGVPREIELAVSIGVPVAVFRPGAPLHRISWALQDINQFFHPDVLLNWLDQVEIRKPHQISFQLGEGAMMPQRAHVGDAGYDLFSAESAKIPPGGHVDVPTRVRMALPPGVWARVTGRSSTFRKYGLLTIEGVIDSGYRGELFVGLYNMNQTETVLIERKFRLAQLIPHLDLNGQLPAGEVSADEFGRIPAPDGRGANGFGSTGS